MKGIIAHLLVAAYYKQGFWTRGFWRKLAYNAYPYDTYIFLKFSSFFEMICTRQ